MGTPSGIIPRNKALEVLKNVNLNWTLNEKQRFEIKSLEAKSDGGVYSITAVRDKIIFFFHSKSDTALGHFLFKREEDCEIIKLYRTIEDKVICS